ICGRVGDLIQMKKEAVPFLESLGIPSPAISRSGPTSWTFLAAKNFIANCLSTLKGFASVY
ncbi:unnamed protein product, partial [Effrenium voratum]